jgi:hypothetical protein
MNFLEQRVPNVKIDEVSIVGCRTFKHTILENNISFIFELFFTSEMLEDKLSDISKEYIESTLTIERDVFDVDISERRKTISKYEIK